MVKASLQIPKEVNTRIWLREPLERVWDQITEKCGEKKHESGETSWFESAHARKHASASAEERWSEAANGASNECEVSRARRLLRDLHWELWKTGRDRERKNQRITKRRAKNESGRRLFVFRFPP